ncbi:hypothetical protein Lal_00018255 [Lupinus albus]|uniref:Glycosyltransferase n=1 Tax=Lupinus albus TaxID=3870 RepID=A0A6A4NFG9_LUPAL|nr:putative hexosyltransferase [Lupinus albus]KAF1866869.1 hypothetical protein Lal_00018255 [Lupinus albus]
MVSETNIPHFILFPLMAQGHIIPMMDIARLLSQREVKVTIFTTPKNASRFTSVISRAVSSGLQIQLLLLQFPSQEVGLPEGCENLDMVPSTNMMTNLFNGITLLQNQAEELFATLTPKPSCIVSDFCIPWTSEISQKYNIPRISFHGFCCFSLHCTHVVRSSKIDETITSDSEYFTIPGLPDQIQVTKLQLPGNISASLNKMEDFREKMSDAETKSYGVIINTFEELEQAYVNEYKKVKNDKVWCIGPVSLCNKDELDKAQRGKKASISQHNCLKWLDLQQPKSVVYVCLGSMCNLIPSQLMELALALESTQRPFIWVIREGSMFKELEKLISEEGFEERIEGRGLIIKGWAPQLIILSHHAIGGFLTHCGWNSTLEGISSGVPMITWPLFGDQFMNEKLVVQVLKIGVSLGLKTPIKFGEEEKNGVSLKKDDIEKAICMVMDEGGESEERRKRAIKLSEMAKKAVEKGGSSDLNMTLLIQEIMHLQASKEEDINFTPKEIQVTCCN